MFTEMTTLTREESAQELVLRVAGGFKMSQAIYVAAKLGVADILADGPHTSEELGNVSGADASSLYRVLRLLATVGIFEEVQEDLFSLTSASSLLQENAAGSLRASVIMTMELEYPAWGELLTGVRTATPAFQHAFGKPG